MAQTRPTRTAALMRVTALLVLLVLGAVTRCLRCVVDSASSWARHVVVAATAAALQAGAVAAVEEVRRACRDGA